MTPIGELFFQIEGKNLSRSGPILANENMTLIFPKITKKSTPNQDYK